MKYEEKYTVTSHDVDINNNLKPSMVLRFMQETANHQMRDRKPSYYDLFFQGKSFVVTRMAIEIYDEVHQYEDILVKTWRCPEKGATFIRCYSIERDGKIMAVGYSEWAVADRNSGGLCRAKDVDISNYETDTVPEFSLNTKFRMPKNLEYVKAGSKQVEYTNVDMNKHMNNTYYPDMLWNFIPDVMEKKVTSINLRFRKEAPLGAVLDVYMAELPEIAKGDGRAEESYTFYSMLPEGRNIEAEIGVCRLQTNKKL